MIQEQKKSGSIAGTLIHTDKGLVSIEQIKVGDMVLSKPDSDPNAPNAYKRVISAFKSSEKEPIQLLGIVNAVRDNVDKWYPENSVHETFLLTENHPIWIDQVGLAYESLCEKLNKNIFSSDQMGWQPANFVQSHMHLVLSDGSRGGCTWDSEEELRSTDVDGLYYSAFPKPSLIWDSRGEKIQKYNPAYELMMYEEDERADFELFISENNLPQSLVDFGRFWFSRRRALHIYGEEVLKTFGDKPNFKLRESKVEVEEKDTRSRLDARDYVYNIEVEEYHTYFIGKLGLWVHDLS